VLRRSAGEGPDLYAFGEVEVDFTRQELRQAGQPVELTPLEFKLLREFIRRRGRALTRDQLLDQIWGPETFLTDRVIDNHIVNLRKKIEPDPAEPRYLVSVRGLGYRFDG
jgi:two-component system alkaline phosphatase synthesis response regulator PhoP